MPPTERTFADAMQRATFKCDVCGSVFDSYSSLRDLMSGKTAVPCKTCGNEAHAVAIDPASEFIFPQSRARAE